MAVAFISFPTRWLPPLAERLFRYSPVSAPAHPNGGFAPKAVGVPPPAAQDVLRRGVWRAW